MATNPDLNQIATNGASDQTDDSVALIEDARTWQQLQTLFHLMEAVAPGERAAALDAAATDPILRDRVLALLEIEDTFTTIEPEAEDPPSNGRVGPYMLLRHLGSGGLGSVYLSERVVGGAILQCAVKLLSMRNMEPAFRSRFHREQQILATLDHPNITRLLDAGISSTSQPYLVMDFVDGVDLTIHCNERQLSVKHRLDIFLSVCNAVAYAHRNLVVHLDLKPSNILVTKDATVKLLDFGTSKLIDPDSAMTTTVMATPAYASPEQLRGEPVTTGCDVYSLGAILYELLTGQRPFRSTSMAMAVNRAAQEREPEPITSAFTAKLAASFGTQPEKLHDELRGDLASIVAKCLRSRAQDRYQSVDALTADLKRYLDGMPVAARRQTVPYRLSKFVRRNKGILMAAAAVLLVLVAGGIFVYVRQEQALQQGRRAEQMQNFMTDLFKLANQNYTGNAAATVPEFLQLGAKVLPEMIHDPADRRAAQLSLGESMYNSRDMAHALPILQQSAASAHAAGDFSVEAESSAFGGLAAFALGQTKLTDEMTSRALSLAHAHGVNAATRIWVEGGYALTHIVGGFDQSGNLSLLKTAVAESRSPEVPERERLWVLEKLALLLQTTGDLTSASKLAAEAYEIVDRQPYALCDRSVILELQANLLSLQGHDADSLPVYRDAVDAASHCSGPGTDYTLAIQDLEARAMLNVGHTQEAMSLLQGSVEARKRSAPENAALSTPLTFLARAYLMNGEPGKAETTAREAIAAQAGKVSPNTTRVALCHLFLAQALEVQQRYKAALAEAEFADRTFKSVPKLSAVERMYATQAQTLVDEARTHDAAPIR